MAKAERNDPCPCGSGKKFKKCCMGKTAEKSPKGIWPGALTASPGPDKRSGPIGKAEHLASPGADEVKEVASPVDHEESEAEDDSTERDPLGDLWEEFEAADYERQLELFQQALGRFEGLDEEYIAECAFELLSRLHTSSAERGERHRFGACLEALRERQPQAYETEIHWILGWLIEGLVAERKFDEVGPPALELAAYAGTEIDEVGNTIRQLAYHGQFDTVRQMMWTGWPMVRDSGGIMGWAVAQFASTGSFLELYDYVEKAEQPDPNDPQLIQRLEHYYPELDDKLVESYLSHLSGSAQREWSLEDFPAPEQRGKKGPQNRPSKKRIDSDLTLLSLDFVRYLHTEEGQDHARAELGRSELTRYILRRNDGELVNRGSMMDRMLNPNRREPKQKMPENILCPDAETMDVFLGEMLYFTNPQHYKVAATFELLPAWLRFLSRQALVDETMGQAALSGLHRNRDSLRKCWSHYPYDPSLAEAMERWPS